MYISCWEGGGAGGVMIFRILSVTILAMAVHFGPGLASLTQTGAQNRLLQRAISHNQITFVLDGVRERAISSIQPDPILLIHFPEIDHQLKASLLSLNCREMILIRIAVDNRYVVVMWILTKRIK